MTTCVLNVFHLVYLVSIICKFIPIISLFGVKLSVILKSETMKVFHLNKDNFKLIILLDAYGVFFTT